MRGGKREGAGRKKGSHNKASQARQREVEKTGITPLAYMLKLMRDPRATKAVRAEMAKAAAPYVHPRLAAVEHTGGDGAPIETHHTVEYIHPKPLK